MKGWIRTSLEALAIVLVAGLLAAGTNALRSDGIPWRMPFPPEYACPSLVAPGTPISVDKALEVFGRADIAWIDARKHDAFARGHIPGALSVPYSFIEPVPDEVVTRLRPFETVIVYDNTEDAARSQRMAGELALAGVDGAIYLEGGALAWVEAGGPYEGEKPTKYTPLLGN